MKELLLFAILFGCAGCATEEVHTNKPTCQYQGEFECGGEKYYSNGEDSYCKLPEKGYGDGDCSKCEDDRKFEGFCECGEISLEECRKKLGLSE